jgi:acyl-coenzyme A synthetase/AMP-(fatty) acid ligase
MQRMGLLPVTSAPFPPVLTRGRDRDGEVERVTWWALKEKIRKASNALRSCSVGEGDVVAALVSHSAEAVVMFLSSVTAGAVFTSGSPDLGVEVCRRTIPVLRGDQAYISGLPDFLAESV